MLIFYIWNFERKVFEIIENKQVTMLNILIRRFYCGIYRGRVVFVRILPNVYGQRSAVLIKINQA